MSNLTQERLKEVVHYEPSTGVFTWKATIGSRAIKGSIAGTPNIDGYILIGIEGTRQYGHRLAFLYVEGYLPENRIDHKDRNTSNNRWGNLREVSVSCNNINRGLQINNTSGVAGVNLHQNYKWRAQIKVNSKWVHLGLFNRFVNAVKARWKAEIKYGWPNCNTTSSAYLWLKEKGYV